jgi:hypothetical protein
MESISHSHATARPGEAPRDVRFRNCFAELEKWRSAYRPACLDAGLGGWRTLLAVAMLVTIKSIDHVEALSPPPADIAVV